MNDGTTKAMPREDPSNSWFLVDGVQSNEEVELTFARAIDSNPSPGPWRHLRAKIRDGGIAWIIKWVETLERQLEVAAMYHDGEPVGGMKHITKLCELVTAIFMYTGVRNRVGAIAVGLAACGAHSPVNLP